MRMLYLKCSGKAGCDEGITPVLQEKRNDASSSKSHRLHLSLYQCGRLTSAVSTEHFADFIDQSCVLPAYCSSSSCDAEKFCAAGTWDSYGHRIDRGALKRPFEHEILHEDITAMTSAVAVSRPCCRVGVLPLKVTSGVLDLMESSHLYVSIGMFPHIAIGRIPTNIRLLLMKRLLTAVASNYLALGSAWSNCDGTHLWPHYCFIYAV
jgi:hypothetical protein